MAAEVRRLGLDLSVKVEKENQSDIYEETEGVNRVAEELGVPSEIFKDKTNQEKSAAQIRDALMQRASAKVKEQEEKVFSKKYKPNYTDAEDIAKSILDETEETLALVTNNEDISDVRDNLPSSAGVRNFKIAEMAMHLAYSGSVTETAKAYGTSTSAIRIMFSDNPEFAALVKEASETMLGELRLKLGKASRKAIDVIIHIMEDEGVAPETRLSAAKDMLNRIGLTETQNIRIDTNQNVHFFSNMSDKELDAIIDVDFS